VINLGRFVDISFEDTEINKKKKILVYKMDYLFPAMLYIYFATCMQHGNKQPFLSKEREREGERERERETERE
jgi:hypothetical protein